MPGTTLLEPDASGEFFATSTTPRLKTDTDADGFALYAMDTMTSMETWRLLAGLRCDRFDAKYAADWFFESGEYPRPICSSGVTEN